ncbi:MAG TPA: non-canonical purine NTP pyrophosphatase [Candidatus Norongarragalinales archaeon]|nr:non-canonical purine NTP pyrophosphatase [Candidatus Norongarragalinales archaeon]
MKTFFLATTNESKVNEAQAVLQKIRLEQVNLEIPEIKTSDMRKTIEEKAHAAFGLVQKPVLVEDTGFFLEAYPGFPGTYTKYCVKLLGLKAFLRLVEGKSRKARFETWIGYCDGTTVRVFRGIIQGKVARSLRGKAAQKLPYDSLFIPMGSKKTFAEMGPKEKQKISHRSRAFRSLEKAFA